MQGCKIFLEFGNCRSHTKYKPVLPDGCWWFSPTKSKNFLKERSWPKLPEAKVPLPQRSTRVELVFFFFLSFGDQPQRQDKHSSGDSSAMVGKFPHQVHVNLLVVCVNFLVARRDRVFVPLF